MKKDIIIDCDPGIDDAIALALATYSKQLNIKLITTVCGNVTIDKITKNTLNFLQAIDVRNIPVAVGAEKPIARQKDNTIQAHGKSGLGDWKFPKCELKPCKENAVEKMHEVLVNADKKIIIIALGPVTNIAMLLMKYPEVKEKIDYIVFSGGLLLDNQSHRYIGFDVMQDPVATDVVWKSGVKLVVCPSDHGHYAYLNRKEIAKTDKLGKTGHMLHEIYKSYKDTHVAVGIASHDACAVAYAINPKIFETEEMYTYVNFLKKEKTAVLNFDITQKPNTLVVTYMDGKKYKDLYFKTLKKTP